MKKNDQPRGTLAILLIFLVLLIISWVGVYLLMLQRGGV
jgi:hypothetical protein